MVELVIIDEIINVSRDRHGDPLVEHVQPLILSDDDLGPLVGHRDGDDPEHALSAFFPLSAYEQVKAIANAGSDWRRRLVAAYKRDVHALHKRLGDHSTDARFLRIEVPQDRARWVEPNEESNKLGYYRVYGTRLVYEVDGKERSFEITSLISWRGEWYLVHLTGFK